MCPWRASSGVPMPYDPFTALGEYLTASEAEALAALLATGEHTAHALQAVSSARRERAAELLVGAGLGHTEPARSAAVLRAIAGAKAVRPQLVPVWTMPGNEATIGHLTSEFHRIVTAARVSVTCATYNFSANSNMWDVLKSCSEQPDVTVCIYVDADKGDPPGAHRPRALWDGRTPPAARHPSSSRHALRSAPRSVAPDRGSGPPPSGTPPAPPGSTRPSNPPGRRKGLSNGGSRQPGQGPRADPQPRHCPHRRPTPAPPTPSRPHDRRG